MDRVVVVTGGASGMGNATARRFAGEGDHVFIVDRAGAQIESGGVQRALDLAPLEPAVGQRGVLMRAGVVDREHLAGIGVEDRHGWVDRPSVRLAPRDGAERTDGLQHPGSMAGEGRGHGAAVFNGPGASNCRRHRVNSLGWFMPSTATGRPERS
ncbi:MAG TPA: SDR family NAD(P)-dependent oxidoreductase [Ilumatobacteraceae bacterium]